MVFNKTDHHDINEILLKVVLNTITLTLTLKIRTLLEGKKTIKINNISNHNTNPGADPGFQVREGGGAHFKKSCQAEGGAKILGYFV